MEIFCLIVIIALLTLSCCVSCFSMYMVQKRLDNQFKLQIESMKHKKNDYISNKPYSELITFVDTIINAHVINSVVNKALLKKSEEELSIIIDDILIDICTKTKASLSADILTALLSYVNEEFLNTYIIDTARLYLVTRTVKKK